jgi:DNA-binding winged helix-turn-helix (wHTH) protein
MSYQRAYTKTSRLDGRSDSQVVYDLASQMKPNNVLTFQELLNALQKDVTNMVIGKSRVYQAVINANKKLQKKNNRYLAIVRGVGYKMIPANEHLSVSVTKKKQAEKKMKASLEILEYTNWDELTPNEQSVHQQHLMLTKTLYQQVKYHHQRLNETDSIISKLSERDNEKDILISKLSERLDKLEGNNS